MKTEILLLIDNSNSRTKFCLMRRADALLLEKRVVPSASLSEEGICGALAGWHYDAVAIASVVREGEALLRRYFGERALFLDSSALRHVHFDCAGAATLGADRVANIAAAIEYGRFPCVALDMGTAVTFELLQKRGEQICYVGGEIAPGLQTMAAALAFSTSLLPRVELRAAAPVIGVDTVSAISSGVWHAFIGMLKESLVAIQQEFDSPLYVVATGGDAALAASYVQKINVVDDDMTLRGILRVWEQQRGLFASR